MLISPRLLQELGRPLRNSPHLNLPRSTRQLRLARIGGNIFDLSVESDNWAGYQTPQRMSAKLKAIPLPFMLGRRVLDVGCDAGFFSFLAAERGASEVVDS
jgi:2-polyprenyl-3-methyl-5-hydroxy-6-metoxy-1,4-benzoquinol methylase